MAFCIKCGTDLLVDEARFCPMCGTPQPDLSQTGGDAQPAQPAAPAAPAEPSPGRSGTTARQPAMGPETVHKGAAPTEDDGFFARAGSPVAAPAAKADSGVTPSRPPRRTSAAPPSASNEAYLWRLGRGDLLVAAGSLVVLLSLFVTWFSGSLRTSLGSQVGALGHNLRVANPVRTDAMGAGAWHWLIFLLSAAVFVYVALRTLPGEGVTLPVPHWQLLAFATGTNLVLVVMSVLLPPDFGSWSPAYGAVVGIVGAIVAFAGSMVRRREPEVITAPAAGRPARPPKPAPQPDRERRARQGRVTRVAHATDLAPTDVDVPAPRTVRTAAAPVGGDARGATVPAPAPGRTGQPDEATRTEERPVRSPARQRAGPAAGAGAAAGADADADADAADLPDEVVCGVCSTVNSTNAKVCRTCGVMLAGRRV